MVVTFIVSETGSWVFIRAAWLFSLLSSLYQKLVHGCLRQELRGCTFIVSETGSWVFEARAAWLFSLLFIVSETGSWVFEARVWLLVYCRPSLYQKLVHGCLR